MSRTAPSRPRIVSSKRCFAIVASRFNEKYVDGLLEHASAEFQKRAPNAGVKIFRVPGAFEIPVTVRELARGKKIDGIVALGVILKGKTDHAEHLARSVTDALQFIAVERRVPVINCVLSLNDDAQAQERCLRDRINRGTEAARAAIEIAELMGELRAKK